MMYLIGGLLIMLLAAVIVALGYRGKAQAEQHHAAMQRQRADDAEAITHHRQQLDTALETLHENQREETINASNPSHLANRSVLITTGMVVGCPNTQPPQIIQQALPLPIRPALPAITSAELSV